MYTFEIYKDAKKEWRWRLKASNGKIIADSAESYKRNPRKQVEKIANAIFEGNWEIAE